jgi:hypothetical protein
MAHVSPSIINLDKYLELPMLQLMKTCETKAQSPINSNYHKGTLLVVKATNTSDDSKPQP